jgi:photosystem II stability/assembly factor-like uncharacterized protein
MNISYANKRAISVWCLLLGCLLCILALSCGKKSPNDNEQKDKWIASNTGLETLFIQYLAVHPTNSNIIFTGTFDGLFKSTDGAETWVRVDSSWGNTQVAAIAFDGRHPEVMYAGTKGGGIWKSEDGGESWEQKNVGLTDPTIFSIATDPHHQDTLFVGTDGGIFRSYTAADTFSRVHHFRRAFLAIDPQNSQIIYAGGQYNNFFKCRDGGDDWTEENNGLTLGGPEVRGQWICIDPVNTQTLYLASSNTGLYKSTDGAGLWTPAPGLGANVVRTIVVNPNNPELLYVATNNGVAKSADSGENWEQMNEGFTSLDVRGLALNPLHSNILYAGIWGEGVFIWGGQ